MFEVKEFQPTPNDFRVGFRYFDPYAPIREKIDIAGQQFRALRRLPCALVLFNNGKQVDLGPMSVIGAMFGDFGWAIPFRPNTGLQLSSADLTDFLYQP